jgi:hypothetical protein
MPFNITLVGEGRRVTGKDQLSKLGDVSLDSGLGGWSEVDAIRLQSSQICGGTCCCYLSLPALQFRLLRVDECMIIITFSQKRTRTILFAPVVVSYTRMQWVAQSKRQRIRTFEEREY